MALLALLKHPLLRLGLRDTEPAIAALERAVLRGPRPRRGSAGLSAALEAFITQLKKFRSKEAVDLHASDPRIALTDGELAAAADLVSRLAVALKPLEGLDQARRPLSDMAARHREVLAALSSDGRSERAFAGPDGSRLAEALDELAISEAAAVLAVAPSDYVELFSAALADRVVRRPPRPGLRVRILGPLEARLTESDRVILGDLSKEHGRRKAGPTPGSAARCARSSASTCPSAASGFRLTILPNCSARAT